MSAIHVFMVDGIVFGAFVKKQTMKAKLFLSAILFTMLFSACEKAEEPENVAGNQEYSIVNDEALLNGSIQLINEPINFKGAKVVAPFSLIASVQSPVVGGVRLSATSVFVKNNKAYVTYAERGEGYKGALNVLNLSNPTTLVLISQVTFSSIDLNASDLSGNVLYLAGSSKKLGAVVIPVQLNGANGAVVNGANNCIPTKVGNAASANGIIQGGNWLYVSTGSTNGGTYCLKKSNLDFVASDLYNGAIYAAANGRSNGNTQLTLESGVNSNLHVYKIGLSDENSEKVIPVGEIKHQNVEPQYVYSGKSTIFMKTGDNVCYVSKGMYGMEAYNVVSGQMVFKSPLNMLTLGNTNAVSADNNYVYMANGADGVAFAEYPQSGNILNIVGVWDDPAYPGSANYVTSDGTYLFVAKGQEGGLKIIKRN